MTLLTHNGQLMTNDYECKVMRPGLWVLKQIILGVTPAVWKFKAIVRTRKTVALRLEGESVEVDYLFADIIMGLNKRGIRTVWSCQGSGWTELLLGQGDHRTHSEHAYIKLVKGQAFPEELLSAAKASGCFTLVLDPVNGHHLTTHYAIPSAYAPEGNQSFRTLFHDYLWNRLDTTGARYRRPLPEAMVVHLLGKYAFEASLENSEVQLGLGEDSSIQHSVRLCKRRQEHANQQ